LCKQTVTIAQMIKGHSLGYTDEARVSRFWRDVRCERIGGGTDEIMIYVAGRQIRKDYQN
ncbi:acyl-CoA dehydrogenase family protein, partial [Shigella boydii]|uniref:acyl-CoA dehydrogenase family protein n=1 Tax=Shigella boydii TaxID=621 RepID=UPI000E5C819D